MTWSVVESYACQPAYGAQHIDAFNGILDEYGRNGAVMEGSGGYAFVYVDDSYQNSQWLLDCDKVAFSELTTNALLSGAPSRRSALERLHQSPTVLKIIRGRSLDGKFPYMAREPYPSLKAARQDMRRLIGYQADLERQWIDNLPLLVVAIIANSEGYSLATLDARARGRDGRSAVLDAGEDAISVINSAGMVQATLEFAESARLRDELDAMSVGLDALLVNFASGSLVDKVPSFRLGYIDTVETPYESTARRQRLYHFRGQLCQLLINCIDICPSQADDLMWDVKSKYAAHPLFKDAVAFVQGWAYRLWETARDDAGRCADLIEESLGEILSDSLNDLRLFISWMKASYPDASKEEEDRDMLASALAMTSSQRTIPITDRYSSLQECLPLLLRRWG